MSMYIHVSMSDVLNHHFYIKLELITYLDRANYIQWHTLRDRVLKKQPSRVVC